jgi:nitroimidazol reductase NimA-like FMN-containing flavoprotein (pyridoxamine 5'-phosphate oxidase superfamily)
MNNRERGFLNSKDLCRLATASRDATPFVSPVTYILSEDDDHIIIATDYGTKKLKNLKENPKVSLVVDDYQPNRGVIIHGDCTVLEKGPDYLRLLKLLFAGVKYYRENPWKEGEAPILDIAPRRIISWGLI